MYICNASNQLPMESKIHNLLSHITPETPNSYLILPLILRQFLTDSAKLQESWSEEAYISMEATRKIAKEYNHCLEEATILCFENKYLRTKHEDNDRFFATVARMNELKEVFEKDDEYFLQLYSNIYPPCGWCLRRSINRLISYMYDKVKLYSNFFSGNLDYKAALFCSNVMLKIAVVSPDNVITDEVIEALFSRAMDYGNIRDFNLSFHFYNNAIDKAREVGDTTYLYIAIQRKLSICLGLSQLDSQTDFDMERMDCVGALNGMLTGSITNSEDLGNLLLKDEITKRRKASFKKKAYYRRRIDKLKEAIPMLSVQLAMSRGDKATCRRYIDKLKEAEQRVYGGNPGFSRADMLEDMYDMLFNSPEREEYEDINKGPNYVPEDNLIPSFPDPENMVLGDKYNFTLLGIRNLILAGLLKSADNYCQTLQLLAEQTKSDYHRAMATNAMAQVLAAKHDIQSALQMYQKALSILEDADPGISDADLSPYLHYIILCEIGSIQKADDPKSAIDTFSKALEWLNKHDMPQMQFMSQILNGRADSYEALGEIALSEKDRTDFLRFAICETKRRILLMDQDSREIFWNDTRRLINETIVHLNSGSGDELKLESYNAVLLAKGILLCNERLLKAEAKNNPDLAALYDKLQDDKTRKQIWGSSYSDSEYTESYLKNMYLSSKLSGVLKEASDSVFPDFTRLASNLGKDDVLVDYYDFDIDNNDKQYIAFVIKGGQSTPDVTHVCKESEMTNFFEEYKKLEKGRKEVAFSVVYEPFVKASHELQEKVWTSVEKLFTYSPSTRVFFVPSGSIHKIAIESLPYGQDWFQTLCDRYASFSRLSHARVLLDEECTKSQKTIGIVADVDYGDNDIRESTYGQKGYSVSMYEEVSTAESWPHLPFTAIESKELQELFKEKNWTISILAGQEAAVKDFNEFSGSSPSILHISTHGFAETRQSVTNIPALKYNFRPLDLTGIVLTNGNEGWLRGTADKHDGILLASEIARMDLSNTDIVFLSCCFSGEGIVKPDGIYGLQRAFLLAGAKTIIMSLWAENEEVGYYFAKEFFSSYLNDKNRHQAFKKAKMAVRELTNDPYYWAGFVMLD